MRVKNIQLGFDLIVDLCFLLLLDYIFIMFFQKVIFFNVFDKTLARALLYVKPKLHESITPYTGGDYYGNIAYFSFCRFIYRLWPIGWLWNVICN